MRYSVMAPPVVIRPILFKPSSVNHRVPSGPAAIPAGTLRAVGRGEGVLGDPAGSLSRRGGDPDEHYDGQDDSDGAWKPHASLPSSVFNARRVHPWAMILPAARGVNSRLQSGALAPTLA